MESEHLISRWANNLVSHENSHIIYDYAIQYSSLLGSVFVASIVLYYYRIYTYWSRRGIKGPSPFPIVGNNLMELLYSRNRTLRAWWKRYGSVYGIYSGKTPNLVVADADIIKDIMVKDAHIFPNHKAVEFTTIWTANMLFFKRDENWKELRSLMAFTMTSGKIKKMYNLMKDASDELISNISKTISRNEPIDIKLTYGCFTLDVIARSAFALKLDSEESEQKYRSDLVAMMIDDMKTFPFVRLIIASLFPKFLLNLIRFRVNDTSMQNQLAAISRKIIDSRRNNEANRRQDLMQLLMDLNKADTISEELIETVDGDINESHHVENYDKQELKDAVADAKKSIDTLKNKTKLRLDDNEIIGNCLLFIIAGYETTSTLLTFATFALACHPDIQERLYQEVKSVIEKESQEKPGAYFEYETVLSMEYLDAVISETLRMFPPAPIMDRQSNQDYKIEKLNLTIPAGGVIIIPFMAVHYDPKYYPEPNAFRPSRFLPENRSKLTPYTYIPFGAGIRHCLGMRFALAEAKLALARLVYNFKFTPIDGKQAKFPPSLAKTFNLLRADKVDVSYSRRL